MLIDRCNDFIDVSFLKFQKDNMGDVNDLYLSLNNVKCWYNRQNTIISVYQIKDYERRQQSSK